MGVDKDDIFRTVKRVRRGNFRPGREGAMKKRGMVMVMDDSELREQIESNMIDTESKYNASGKSDFLLFSGDNIYKRSKEAKDEMMSLLDKCNAFNVISQKWSKPSNAAHIDKDTTPDRLKQAIDVTMERLETWSPKSWADLVKELQFEMKVAYDKFSNVRKKYYGWIETSQGNQGGELVKAYIARDIQDYVKYGINMCCVLCTLKRFLPTQWLRKIAIHFEFLARELKGLNVRNETNLRRFAEDVSLYKQCMLEFADNLTSGLDDSNSEAYLMLRQKGGIPFSDLIERKKNELGFVDEFIHLSNPQQLEVYQRIIDEFGGANISDVQFFDFIFGDGTINLFFLPFRRSV